MHSTSQTEYLAPCCTLAKEAGKLIMGFVQSGFDTQHKDDHSPVTEADIAANDHITRALKTLTPDIPVIAEEDDQHKATNNTLFWLVDPLDGTRSFVRGEGEFTVNIGLIKNDTPILGVIYVPTEQCLYFGTPQQAWKQEEGQSAQIIQTRNAPKDGMTIFRSRSHASPQAQSFLDQHVIAETIPASSSIKFCWVAEGRGDMYPRFGRTMEWDSAAGHAILLGAGGRVVTLDNQPLRYGKPGYENPAFIAYGK